MKAVILARVSTKEQEEDGKSILAQVDRLKGYCERKGLDVIKQFEIIESSTRGVRKDFNAMIDFIVAQKEKVALVADAVDRVQRSFKESVLLDDLRRRDKVDLHFMREGLVIDEDSRGSQIMMWDFAVMTAKSYVLSLSDNVRRTVDYKLKNGEWIGRAPVGYLNSKDPITGQNAVVIDTQRSYLIQKAFELYSTGTYSVGAITTLLKKEGLTNSLPPHRAMVKSQIHKMLLNPFYYGYMLCKNVLYKGKYEPIIDKELFDRCQAVREGWHKKPFKYATKEFALRGLVRCAHCGCAISFDIKKKKYVYGSCSKAKGDCGALRVTEKDLLTQISDLFKNLSIPEDKLIELKEKLQVAHDAKQKIHTTEIAGLRCEYDSIQRQLTVLFDMRLQESITQNQYDEKATELKDRQYAIDAKLKLYTEADGNFIMTVSYLLDIATRANALFLSSKVDQKRRLISFVLSNLTLEGKKLRFNLKEPFDAILQANERSEWLPLVDAFRTNLYDSILSFTGKFSSLLEERELQCLAV